LNSLDARSEPGLNLYARFGYSKVFGEKFNEPFVRGAVDSPLLQKYS
jgi:hypothetical protein